MKRSLLFILVVIICSSCSKVYDYTSYSKGSVLKGTLKDGQEMYLIRENDSLSMEGIGFVHSSHALVQPIPYKLERSGVIYFQDSSSNYQGKAKLKKKGAGMKVYIPKMSEYGVQEQTFNINYWDFIEDEIVCENKFKRQSFDSIVVTKNIPFAYVPGYYTTESIDTVDHGNMSEYKKLILGDLKRSITAHDSLPLLMDMYKPYDSGNELRPAFMFIHGGGFFLGDKNNRLLDSIKENLVKKGYIVVSIDYRLGTTVFGVKSVEKVIYLGVQDSRAALRYITHNSHELGIDPNQIFIGGSSAGAIIALNTAFMDDDEIFRSAERRHIRRVFGNINTSGNNLKDRYSIAGVVSMWGAVVDLSIIDGRNADIPVLLFHGTSDNIVPFNSGLPFQVKLDNKLYNNISERWRLYGSYSIYNRLRELNMPVRLFSFEGYGHEPQVNKDGTYNDNMNTINREIDNFMYRNSREYPQHYSITGHTEIYPYSLTALYTVENAYDAKIEWFIEGGVLIERTGNTASVAWFDTSKSGKVTACITDDSGIAEKVELLVKIRTF